MSTVLWANTLIGSKVESDESDKYALYKHSRKLEKLTRKLQVTSFAASQDYTDMQFNMSDEDLPEGMESTDDVMAQEGAWISGDEAVAMLEALISHISDEQVRFGILSNDREDVLTELKESLDSAKKAANANGKFNFSVVM